MRVMLDTNVLISAIVLKSTTLNQMLEMIINEHKLVLSSYVIEELKQVVSRKFKGKLGALDKFLTVLPYEFVYTPDAMDDLSPEAFFMKWQECSELCGILSTT